MNHPYCGGCQAWFPDEYEDSNGRHRLPTSDEYDFGGVAKDSIVYSVLDELRIEDCQALLRPYAEWLPIWGYDHAHSLALTLESFPAITASLTSLSGTFFRTKSTQNSPASIFPMSSPMSHRGVFHTPALYFLLYVLWVWKCPASEYMAGGNCLFAGILSHILLDRLNPGLQSQRRTSYIEAAEKRQKMRI